jgi:hypothetical protein
MTAYTYRDLHEADIEGISLGKEDSPSICSKYKKSCLRSKGDQEAELVQTMGPKSD